MALKVGELYASFGIDSTDLGKALNGIEKQCQQAAATLAKSGAVLSLAVTTPLVALGKDILGSAINYESAFAGVMKTVDAKALAAAGMSYEDLSEAIKKMTLVAPQSAEALASIMEAGGQLGIDVTALEGFTKTIAAIGVTTNLTTEEAASMFAKFANITGMSQSEFENLGSTVVALGNNFATTEADIMSMAMRMASAGTTIGMSESDILAFAAAMSSVGIMSEVGGSSFSTFASNLSLAVATSSADLETYASVAGMSAEEFRTAFETDAASAINAFIQGLNDVDRNGMSAIQILDALGIKEVGMRNMLLSLANSGSLLTEALNMSSDAWEDNIALLEEANQRYGTTESQIQIMKNALELIKIDLGDFALPHIQDLTGHVIAATKAFLGLDDATKVAIIKMGGLAAATGPALAALGGLVGFAGNLAPILGAIISPIGLLGTGLALFAIAAVDANNDIGKSLEAVSITARKSLALGNASVASSMWKISKRIPAIAGSIVKVIGNTIPGIMQIGFTALTGFANVFSDNADVIGNVGMSIVENVCSGLVAGFPRLIPAAARLVTNLGTSMISNLPRLVTSIGEVASSIWNGLKSVDWRSLGSQMLTAISSAFSQLSEILSGWFNSAKETLKGISWTDVGESIKSGFVFASDWLKNLIAGDAGSDTVTWAGIGSSIWNSIKSGISVTGDWLKQIVLGNEYTPDSAWSDVGSAIWSVVKAGIVVTGDWIKQIILGDTYTPDAKWSEVGSVIWSAIKGGFSATGDWVKSLILGESYTVDAGWDVIGSAIWAKIQTGVKATGDWLAGLIMPEGTTFEAGTGWSAIGKSVWTAIKGGISATGDWLATLIMPANTAFEAGSGWEAIGTSVWTRIQAGITATGDWVKSLVLGSEYTADASWSTVGSAIWSKIKTGITATGDWIKGLILGNAFTVDSDWTDVGEKIVNMISSGLSRLDFSAETMAANLSSLGTFVQTFVKNMLERKVDFSTSITTFLSNLVGAISDYNGWSTLAETFGTIASSIISGIISAIPNVVGGATSFINAISSMISSPAAEDFLTSATAVASSIVQSIASGVPHVLGGAQAIISAIGNLLSSIDWSLAITSVTSIGEAMLNAIIYAIGSIGDFGVNIIDTVCSTLSNIDWSQIAVDLTGFGMMIINGIVNGISVVTNAADTIVKSVGSILANVDWSTLSETAQGIGSTLIDGIVTGVKSLVNSGKRIVDSIVDVVRNIKWTELGTSAGDLAGTLTNGLIEGLKDLTPDLTELINSIVRGINNIGDGFGKAAGSFIGRFISALFSGDNWTKLVKSGGLIVEGILEGIVTLGVGILEGAYNLIAGFCEQIMVELGLIEETDTRLGSAIERITNLDTFEVGADIFHNKGRAWLGQAVGAWQYIVEHGTDELIAQYEEFSWLANDQVYTMFDILTGDFATATERAAAIIALQDLGLGDFIDNATEGMDESLYRAVMNAVEYLSSGDGASLLQSTLSSLGIQIPQAVLDGLAAGMSLVEAYAAASGQEAAAAYADGQETGETDVEAAVANVVEIAEGVYSELPDITGIIGSDAATGLANGVTSGETVVTEAMAEVSDAAVEAFLKEMSYDTGYELGQKYTTGIQQGANSMRATLTAAMASIASDVRSTVSSILSTSVGTGIGYQFANGIAQGIRSGISLIIAAATAAADAAVGAATGTLRIQSPSRVGRDVVGKQWDAGIALGVLQNAGLIADASHRVVATMSDMFMVGDPSRGTVYSSARTARQTARENAAQNADGKSQLDQAKAMGTAIAEELINSGVLEGDFIIDGEATGRKVAGSVSRKIHRDSKKTVSGRTGKAVFA